MTNAEECRREYFACPTCGRFLWTTQFLDGVTYRHCSCGYVIKADDFKPRDSDRDTGSR